MRKMIVLLAALFVAASSTFAFSVKTNDDGIPIPLECNESEMDTIIWRAPLVPISAVVMPAQSIISVTFLRNVGDVSIEVSNLYTGEDYYYEEYHGNNPPDRDYSPRLQTVVPIRSV